MDSSDQEFLLDLLNTPSPTGFESAGQRKWAARVREFASDVQSDAYGNAWARLDAENAAETRTVMIEAHADEIGYMVRHITDDGYLRIDRIGASDWVNARGRRVTVFGDKGETRGIIGNTAIHLRENKGEEKAPEVHELYVDIGASSADEVAELGIRVGHPAVYADGAELFGSNRITGRALDNRIGGYIIARVVEDLSREKNAANLIALNAVQEEIGGNGAKMAAYRLMPDVCLVLDVTHATDTPAIEHSKHGHISLGGGPTLTHGTVNHPEVVNRLMEVAGDLDIPIQHEASSRSTLTDTDQIFQVRHGIPSALISLPLRYMHSVVETADFDDVEKCIALMAGFARSITADDAFRVEI